VTVIALESPTRSTGYGLRQAVRAEFTKLRTLRSTWWTILVTAAGSLLITGLACNSARGGPGFDSTNQSLVGLMLGALTMGVLGLLAVTGEYGTGAIRSSFAATPRRGVLFAAKMIVVGTVSVVVGLVLSFACYGLGQLVLHQVSAPTASLSQHGVLAAVVLSGLAVGLIGLIATGFGLIVRNTAGGLAAFAGLLFLLPIILQRMPDHLARFTPEFILSNTLSTTVNQFNGIPQWEGVAFLVGTAGLLLTLGVGVFARRDP
jgi:hypothetical protein